MFPAIGWVRADRVSSEELLTEINELRKQNSQLQKALANVQTTPTNPIQNLAGLDESIEVHGRHYYRGSQSTWKATASWSYLFALLAPYLMKHPNEAIIKGVLEEALFKISGGYGTSPSLDDQDFQTIAVQLKALGLVNLQYTKTVQGGMALFWSATPAGERMMLELRTVRSDKKA